MVQEEFGLTDDVEFETDNTIVHPNDQLLFRRVPKRKLDKRELAKEPKPKKRKAAPTTPAPVTPKLISFIHAKNDGTRGVAND